MLKPAHQHPAPQRPGRADAPTANDVRRIVNAKVDAAHAYEDRQKRRENDEITTDLGRGLVSRQKRRDRQIGDGRQCRVAAWEAGGKDPRCRSDEIGARAANANFSRSLSAMPPNTAKSISHAAARLRAKNR
jgi:hypothetical protein